MTGRIAERLAHLDITLPEATAPVANYLPWVRERGLVVVSGQLPLLDGKVAHAGILGDGVDVDEGYKAARLCAINLLAHLRAACGGNLDAVTRVVRLGGFVASAPTFTDQPKVINGASDLMVEVLGDAGRHARAAVGCPSLPLNACVEVEGLFAVAD